MSPGGSGAHGTASSLRTGTGSDPSEGGVGPLDVRLLAPALVAWAVLAWLIGGSSRAMVIGGLAATVAALSLARHRATLALTLAATALVLLAASLHLASAREGPVPALGEERAVVTLSGTVTSEPRLLSRGDERTDLVVLDLRVDEVDARGSVAAPRSPVVVFADDPAWAQLSWHSRVRAVGRLGPVEPGSDTVAAFAPVSPPTVLDRPGAVLRGAELVRERLRGAVQPLPEDARGLVPGLVIGDTSLTPESLTQAMLATGMTHLSAVSGSNVAIVIGAVVLCCGWLGLGRRWRPPVAVASIVLFVILCRPEPSVLRAGVMGGIGLLAMSSARRRVSLPALGGAVLVLLCADPWLARSHGFALSTLATLGLVVFARPWGRAIASRLPPRARVLGDAVAIPLAAQVACAPVIVLLQGSVSTVAVLANLLAAPLVAPTTVAGIVAGLAAVLWPPLGTAVAWVGAVPAWLIGQVARWCARLPLGVVDWWDGAPGAALLALLTVLALLAGPWLRHHARRRPSAALAALLLVLALVWPVPRGGWPPERWVVVGCDVGQGDAFVVPTGPARAVLVDTGPDPEPVARCLTSLGVRRLDAVVLTHFHADHVGGLEGVLATLDVGAVYATPVREPAWQAAQVDRLLEQAQVPLTPVVAGDRLTAGSLTAEVVWPDHGSAGRDANDASVVLEVDVAGIRVLFTGDIEPDAARSVRRRVASRHVDVLKVPHHGSAAQDPALLRDSGARVALIGVGEDNPFGHPTDTALRLLAEAGTVVLRTDLHGDVAVVVDGQGRLGVVTERGG